MKFYQSLKFADPTIHALPVTMALRILHLLAPANIASLIPGVGAIIKYDRQRCVHNQRLNSL